MSDQLPYPIDALPDIIKDAIVTVCHVCDVEDKHCNGCLGKHMQRFANDVANRERRAGVRTLYRKSVSNFARGSRRCAPLIIDNNIEFGLVVVQD